MSGQAAAGRTASSAHVEEETVKDDDKKPTFQLGTKLIVSKHIKHNRPGHGLFGRYSFVGKVTECKDNSRYVVEFRNDKWRGIPDDKRRFTQTMSEEEVAQNPYVIFSKHIGNTHEDDCFTYDTPGWQQDSIDWDAFLKELHKCPEIAHISVDDYGAPALMYILMIPNVPFTVVSRLIEINPKATNYQCILMDVTNWLHLVMTWYDRRNGYRHFSTKIDPKILRLAVKSSTLRCLTTAQCTNGYTPILEFVEDDQEKLTPQAKAVLEASMEANMWVLEEHFDKDESYKRIKLGSEALRFCLNLIKGPGEDLYYKHSRIGSLLRDEVAKLSEKEGEEDDEQDKKPAAKKQKVSS